MAGGSSPTSRGADSRDSTGGVMLGSPSLSSAAVVSFPRDRKEIVSSRRANRVIVNTSELSQDVIASAGYVVVSIRPRHVSLSAAGARVTLMNRVILTW